MTMLTQFQRWWKALRTKAEQQPAGSAWSRGARHQLYDAANDRSQHNWFGSKSWFFGRDPAGIMIEIGERHDDRRQRTRAHAVGNLMAMARGSCRMRSSSTGTCFQFGEDRARGFRSACRAGAQEGCRSRQGQRQLSHAEGAGCGRALGGAPPTRGLRSAALQARGAGAINYSIELRETRGEL